jgi:hypothetical protein
VMNRAAICELRANDLAKVGSRLNAAVRLAVGKV